MNTVRGEIFFFYLYLNGRAVELTQFRVQGTGFIFLVTDRRMFALINQHQD